MTQGRWRRAVTLTLTAALTAALLYLSFRDIDWRELVRIAGGASPTGLVLTAAIGTVALLLRAVRWRLLLETEGAVSVRTAFLAVAAGYFGNSFLPARAGDLVRAFMVSSRSLLDTTFVLTTAVAERIADGVALVAMGAVILLTVPAQLGWLAGALKPLAVLALLGALLMVIVPLFDGVGATVLDRLRLSASLRLRVLGTIDQGMRGIRAFHNRRRMVGFAGLTVLVWCADALGTVVGGLALGLDIPFSAAFLLLASLGVASALPSTPGFVGIYQFAALSALTPFGFSPTDAVAYILVVQAVMTLVMGVFGSVGLLEYRRSKSDSMNW